VKGNIALAINALKVAALTAESKSKKAIEESDLPASRLYYFYVKSIRHPKSERSFRNMESPYSNGFAKAIGEKRVRVYEIGEAVENVVSKG
jgi:hypothetical protein